jgi:hypothetical protein
MGKSFVTLIEHLESIIIRIDRYLSAFESRSDIAFEHIESLPCLDTTLQFEDIELLLRVDFLFSFFEILFLLLYDDDFIFFALTDAFTTFIEGSRIFSWHRKIIEKRCLKAKGISIPLSPSRNRGILISGIFDILSFSS